MKQPQTISKVMFCWLALLTGSIGGQWIYAGRKRFIPLILCFPLSAFWSWGETMYFGLMADDKFNQKINPHLPPDTPQTTAGVVIAVGLSLAVSVAAFMSLLAMLFQFLFSGTVA